MEDFKIGSKCNIEERVLDSLALPYSKEFYIKDILLDDLEFPVVIGNKDFGEDWSQFFNYDELIKL